MCKKLSEIDAINLIKDSCDEIEPYWKEHIEFWDEDDERGYYNDMSVFAHYVVDQLSKGKTDDFKKIFNACEYIHKNGSEEVIEVLDLGFIESILFISSHKSFGTHAIEPYMGPIALSEYIGLRDAFDKLAQERWESYSPTKKLFLTVRSKLVNILKYGKNT
ncbi:MAG: hypothetical protein OEV42_03350 [Deltaproteobacteria bacterium]|nr:hypothetical protein [Deltaproteobacteria bacterium]